MFFKHTDMRDAPIMAAAVVGACRGEGWSDPFPPLLLEAIFGHLMEYPCNFSTLEPVSIAELRDAIPSQAGRSEVVDLMVTVELLCNPIPESMEASVEAWADGLDVDSDELHVARELARGAQIQAQADFYRTSYIGRADAEQPGFDQLLQEYGPEAYVFTVVADPALEAKYETLRDCAPGTLGRGLWEHYKQRGFVFPGVVGGANQALARHDWLHVLSGYETTSIGEVELAAFRAMSTDFPGVGLGFLGNLIHYQSALLPSLVNGGHPGHELEVDGVPERIAEALRRGKACKLDPYGAIDLFDYADRQVDELRTLWSIEISPS